MNKPITRRRLCAAAMLAAPAAMAQPLGERPILIGQTYVGTGPLAGLSTDPVAGTQAFIAAANAAGGIRGRPLELRLFDDAYDAGKAGANVRSALAAGAVAMLMPIGTTPSEAALGTASEVRIPVVGAYSGAGSLARFQEFGFPVRISFAEEYERIVRHLLTIGMTRIVFVHNDNPGARSAMEGTRKTLAAQGHPLHGSVSIRQDAADAASQGKAVAAMVPEAVLLSVTNQVAERFLPSLHAGGSKAQVYSFSFLNGRALQSAIGSNATGVVICQVVPSPWMPTRAIVVEYQNAMKRTGKELSYGSLEGFISAKILCDAIRHAGPVPSPAAVHRALESLADHDLGGVRVRYAPGSHRGLGYSELTMLKSDGAYAR